MPEKSKGEDIATQKARLKSQMKEKFKELAKLDRQDAKTFATSLDNELPAEARADTTDRMAKMSGAGGRLAGMNLESSDIFSHLHDRAEAEHRADAEEEARAQAANRAARGGGTPKVLAPKRGKLNMAAFEKRLVGRQADVDETPSSPKAPESPRSPKEVEAEATREARETQKTTLKTDIRKMFKELAKIDRKDAKVFSASLPNELPVEARSATAGRMAKLSTGAAGLLAGMDLSQSGIFAKRQKGVEAEQRADREAERKEQQSQRGVGSGKKLNKSVFAALERKMRGEADADTDKTPSSPKKRGPG